LFRLIFTDLQNVGVISAAPCRLNLEDKNKGLCTIVAFQPH